MLVVKLMLLLLAAIVVASPFGVAAAQTGLANLDAEADSAPAARRFVEAMRRTGPVRIDGDLSEEAWELAPVISEFKQREPVQGAWSTEPTEIRILFDDDALYIGARLYDSAPDSIIGRLARRDGSVDSDIFGFFIDPYLDRRSGFYFGVNAAGTLYDGVLMNDDWDDDSWDGVWEGKSQIDALGWSVEMRIPFSQLRFYKKDEYVWGVNFRRDILRKNEETYLVYQPRNESGFVSRFVDLIGVRDVSPRRQIEALPYVTARAELTHPEAEDPFNDGSRYVPGIGADVKVGLTTNLTLNTTINPDFGQVEVDPAVVNLSDVETFFQERRPFFIEGANMFSFGRGGSSDNWSFNWTDPNLFYSRRIGRTPQGELPEHDFARRLDGTRILGAGKLTGRVAGSWNVGTIQAVTARETASFQLGPDRLAAEVEPLAYYGVFRTQKEFKDGRNALGLMGTIVERDMRDDRLAGQINRQAYVVGADGWTFLDATRTWVFTGWASVSHVRGTPERILALQQSSLHYFQRPDARYVRVDSTATSLTGISGRLAINKQRGNFFSNSAFGVVSPGYHVNDVGFLRRTDVINGHVGAGYTWSEPTRFYRRIQAMGALFGSKDFDGNTVWAGIWARSTLRLPNYYFFYLNAAVNPTTINNRRTRGGPLMLNEPGFEMNTGMESDNRKPWVLGMDYGSYYTASSRNGYLEANIAYKPVPKIAISLSPGISWNLENAQYVAVYEDPLATATFGKRYVFAALDQVTVSSSIRLNWTFTPTLSLQLFAQPLISVGDYDGYKALSRPRSYDFHFYGEGESSFDPRTLEIDADGDGPAPAYVLSDPNFNFKSLRGTAVLRWEYRPGSTLYLVWTQSRSDEEDSGSFRLRPSIDRLLDAAPDNIFALKLTYWLSR